MKIGIGILCYTDNFIRRVLNWVSKLENREEFIIMIYHDNTPFDSRTTKLIEDKDIILVEGKENKGMFVARQNLIYNLCQKDIDCFMMCDDDDLLVSNFYEIINKYRPMNETSCIYFYSDYVYDKMQFQNYLLDHKILSKNYNPKPDFYASNTLFNVNIIGKLNEFILKDNYKFIKKFFETDRILSGEDEILIQLHSEFNRFLFGINTKYFTKEVTMITDLTDSTNGRYDIVDHRYASDKDEAKKLYDEFWNKMEQLQPSFKRYLKANYEKYCIK